MNILIVDDDAYVLEVLMQKMDWENIGIENVYTAYNVKRAKRIIEDIPIHIVVCDIEMPKENGFTLLSWIREQGLIIQFIFLTSYAEFSYAKKAIELQSFAYALKPIAYDELASEIRRAISSEEAALKRVDYERIYEYWNDTEKNRKDTFWARLCIQEDFRNSEEVWEEVMKLDVGFSRTDLFVPLIFSLIDFESVIRELGRGMLEWTFKNMAEDLLTTECCAIQGAVSLAPMEWLIMVQGKDNGDGEAEGHIYNCARKLCEKIRQHFKCSISCVAGRLSVIDNIKDSYLELARIVSDNAVSVNDIYIAGHQDYSGDEYLPPDFVAWEEMFNEYQEEGLKQAIGLYIKNLSVRGHCSKKVLQSFVMDCIQMFSSELKQRHILLHSVGDGACFENRKIFKAIQSPDEALRYLEAVLHVSLEAIRGSKENMSVVDLVKDYIEHNLDKDITRESLAELVYLNPDYLARVFKKETGESLGSWLVHRRIEKAKEYLEKTSDPVNTVAIKVGYDNFSYFSKVFKDIVGVTPKEYRKR